MKLKGQEQMIQQLQGQVQTMAIEAKARTGTAEINAHAKVLTARIQADGEREERQITADSAHRDTVTHALTAQNVAEINALARILTTNSDQAHDLRKMLATFGHDEKMMDKQQTATETKGESANAT